MDFVSLKEQQVIIKSELDRRISDVLKHGKYIMGPEVYELEDSLQTYAGAKYCITTASGTEALLISLLALGIGPGDEVITTPFTFISTVETIVRVGAKPIFVDIEADVFNIDSKKIEAQITERTKAIVPVSLYGQPADINEIQIIANKYNLKVIIDGAQSFGSTYNGKTDSSFGNVSITSFFPAKPLGCYGDGGAIFTNSDEYAEKMKMIRIHGQSQANHYEYIGVGGRLDTIQAAILLAKLPIYQNEITKRQKVSENYSNSLGEVIKIPVVRADRTSVWAQYTISIQNRDKVQVELEKCGIPTAVYYPIPLHMQNCFQYLGLKEGDYPVAEKVSREVISLPMGPYLHLENQGKIIENVLNVVTTFGV